MGTLKVSYTDKCYRLAMTPEQGVGWSEYSGEFPMPEGRVGTLRITDSKGRTAWIVFDAKTGKPYLLANRDGPAGSGIEKIFVDKKSAYYGAEIPCRILRKEAKSEGEDSLESLNHSAQLRPQEEANKGAAGYTDKGFRAAQRLNIGIRKDGELIDTAEQTDLSETGGVAAFDKKVEGRRLQLEYRFAASEFKVVGFKDVFLNKNTKGTPEEVITAEQDYQNEFMQHMVWLSRGKSLTVNRATGAVMAGSTIGAATGPDNKTLSTMVFGAVGGLTVPISNIIGNFTIVFSVTSLAGTSTICSSTAGGFSISLVNAGLTWAVQYQDASGIHTKPINWDGTGWATIKVTRNGNILSISESGALLQTFILGSIETIGGTFKLMENEIGAIFDFRLLASAMSDEAFAYYYNDLINNAGNAFLPLW